MRNIWGRILVGMGCTVLVMCVRVCMPVWCHRNWSQIFTGNCRVGNGSMQWERDRCWTRATRKNSTASATVHWAQRRLANSALRNKIRGSRMKQQDVVAASVRTHTFECQGHWIPTNCLGTLATFDEHTTFSTFSCFLLRQMWWMTAAKHVFASFSNQHRCPP